MAKLMIAVLLIGLVATTTTEAAPQRPKWDVSILNQGDTCLPMSRNEAAKVATGSPESPLQGDWGMTVGKVHIRILVGKKTREGFLVADTMPAAGTNVTLIHSGKMQGDTLHYSLSGIMIAGAPTLVIPDVGIVTMSPGVKSGPPNISFQVSGKTPIPATHVHRCL